MALRRLHSPNVYYRDIAQRLLCERNQPEARAKLRRVPDGTWRSRVYGSAVRGSKPYVIVCAATKTGDCS